MNCHSFVYTIFLCVLSASLFKSEYLACTSLSCGNNNAIKSKAFFTYYENFPFCCSNSPNYDPKSIEKDCSEDAACDYIGYFAALGNQKLDYVKQNNLVVFYDNADPDGIYWATNYANRTIEIKKEYKGTIIRFNATIVDQCDNEICENCCKNNVNSEGYLITMEYYTVMRNFGDVNAVDGFIDFTIF